MAEESNPDAEIYKLLSTPEAESLAELYLIQVDLTAAYDTLDLYFTKYAATNRAKESKTAIISSSLFRDGILLFCSCFSRKDRSKLHPEAVYGHLGKEAMAYARKLLDMRDAFIAHNFGPQRQHSIVIVCQQTNGQIAPCCFTQYFVRFSGWVEGERNQLLPFIKVARDHLERLIEAAEIPVMKQVTDITPSALQALPDAELAIPGPSDYRSNRSRFQKSKRGSRSPIPQRRLGRTVITGA